MNPNELCIEMTSTKNTICMDGICPTLTARMGTGGGQVNAVLYDRQKQGVYGENECSSILTAHEAKEGNDIVCQTFNGQTCGTLDAHYSQCPGARGGVERDVVAVDCRNGTESETNGTLQAHEGGGTSYNLNNVCRERYIVRRLTPLECERLQGYPSGFEVDVSKMTKDEYIAFNLASGNIIADAETGKVFATRGPGGKKLDEPIELKGTDIKGYRVVSIRNGQTKLQCRVHRIIWISQHGIIPDGYCIDHINNNKSDNRISNLQLLTPEQNSHKAHDDGLYKYGLDNKATKIDPAVKDEIAFVYAISDLTQRQLAEMYGISKSRIGQIIKEVGWTDIGEWTDTKGKKHKAADSPRYKALGNSIAIPPWLWVLSRLNDYCEEKTMASLFDGIGGFPLIWEFLNGKGSAVWCSEIEEFPIAVTKARFPDD